MPKKKAATELSNGDAKKRRKVVEKHRVDDVNIRKLTPLVPPGCVLEVRYNRGSIYIAFKIKRKRQRYTE